MITSRLRSGRKIRKKSRQRLSCAKSQGDLKVVGIDRDWPGKVLADAAEDFDTG